MLRDDEEGEASGDAQLGGPEMSAQELVGYWLDMPQKQFMQNCARCGQQTPHIQQKPNHILHLILSVVTVGLWLPIWLLVGIFRARPQCMTCGKKPGLFGIG